MDGGRSDAHCRKKFYHVNISVYPTLHAVDFDVMKSSMAFVPNQVVQALREAGMSQSNVQRQFCLLALGLKNPTTSSIQVSCNVELGDPSEECRHSLMERISPLESKR